MLGVFEPASTSAKRRVVPGGRLKSRTLPEVDASGAQSSEEGKSPESRSEGVTWIRESVRYHKGKVTVACTYTVALEQRAQALWAEARIHLAAPDGRGHVKAAADFALRLRVCVLCDIVDQA